MRDAPLPRHDRHRRRTSTTDTPLHSPHHHVLQRSAGRLGGPRTRTTTSSSRDGRRWKLLVGVSGAIGSRVHCEAWRCRRRSGGIRSLADSVHSEWHSRRAGCGGFTCGGKRTAGDSLCFTSNGKKEPPTESQTRNQVTNSPIHQVTNFYRKDSIISSNASFPGLTLSSGSVASGSSTTCNSSRKSSRSGSM